MTDEAYVSSGRALDIRHVAWVLSVYDDNQTKVVARVGRLTHSPHHVVVALVAYGGDAPGITAMSHRDDDDESAATYTAFRPFTQSEAGRLGVAIDRVTAGGGL